METTAESLPIEIDPSYLNKDSDEIIETLFSLISKVEKIDDSLLIIDILPQPPQAFSIILICRNLSSFPIKKNFEEFLEKRLLPGSDILIQASRITHFKLPTVSADTFIFCQMDGRVNALSDFSDVVQNFHERIEEPFKHILQFPDSLDSVIESSFGVRSRKILSIQQELNKVSRRFLFLQKPNTMDFLRHSLSCIGHDFLNLRESKHIAQVLLRLHLVEQKLEKEAFRKNTVRHSCLHLKRTMLSYQFSSKEVIGVSFGITFFQEKEVLEQALLENIIIQTFPSFSIVRGSFFSPPKNNKKYKSIYFELEKLNGKEFCAKEIQKLRTYFSQQVKARIPVLIPSIKISRNEEEIMKTILHLSNETTTFGDLPQVSISYDHHNEKQMIFRVILVTIEREDSSTSLKELLQKEKNLIHILWEREQVIRFMDEGDMKKVYVFQVTINETHTLPKNNSSGFLYFVRQKVVTFLEKKIGKFRDYNGGMIEKQKERYDAFISSFQGMSQDYTYLADNFFFSISPIEAQATYSFEDLRTLFSLVLTIDETPMGDQPIFKRSSKDDTFFLVLKIKDTPDSKGLFEQLNLTQKYNVSSLFTIEQVTYLALLSQGKKETVDHVESLIQSHQKEMNQQQILRLSFDGQILSFDPRFAGDYITAVYGKMLFEGLMRFDHTDTPQLAIAESYTVSNKQKRYIFQLRKSYWSNGEPVTAQDFEYAWKSILTPAFQTPFDYLFYPILNAKSAKRGQVSKDKIGIKAIDASTLVIDLQHPFPSFLSLLCYPIFSPIHQQTDQVHPSWSSEEGKRFVCNGPFSLQSRSANEFNIIKNITYWDHAAVNLESIKIIKADAHLAVDLFQSNQIDWLGRPIDSWQPFFDCVTEGHEYYPNSLYWFVLNTRKFPFTNQSIRRAFALAIDQAAILKDLAYNGEPACTPLPKQHTLHGNSTTLAYDPEKAVQLFDAALRKLSISRESFPMIPLACPNNTLRRQIAEHVKQCLVNVLGIDVVIQTFDWSIYFNKMCEGEFLMGGINWSTWIDDPSYTLQSFTEGERKTNFSKWEDSNFTALVNQGTIESDPQARLEYWKLAEKVLIEHVPVIPMFYEFYRYAKSPHLKNTLIFPSQGIIDFKHSKVCNKT